MFRSCSEGCDSSSTLSNTPCTSLASFSAKLTNKYVICLFLSIHCAFVCCEVIRDNTLVAVNQFFHKKLKHSYFFVVEYALGSASKLFSKN